MCIRDRYTNKPTTTGGKPIIPKRMETRVFLNLKCVLAKNAPRGIPSMLEISTA